MIANISQPNVRHMALHDMSNNLATIPGISLSDMLLVSYLALELLPIHNLMYQPQS